MEILDIFEYTRQVGRIGQVVADESHQYATCSRIRDPPLLASVVVATTRIIVIFALDYLLGDLMSIISQSVNPSASYVPFIRFNLTTMQAASLTYLLCKIDEPGCD